MNTITTLLLFPFQPRRVARAHAHTPMWKIYLIHWLGMFLLGGVLVALDCVATYLDDGRREATVHYILMDFEATIITLFVIVCGEASFVLMATVMTCWAGRDEPVVETWRHALRVSWLYVAHLVWVVSACGSVIVAADELNLGFEWIFPILSFVAGTIIWSIVSYLRAMTVPRETPVPPTYPICGCCQYNVSHLDPAGACPECGHPIADSLEPSPSARAADPICEWCGYNLSHLDPAGRCPECGRSIADSIENNPRVTFQSLRTMVGSAVLVWTDPQRPLRSLAVSTQSPLAIRFYAATLTLAGLSAWTGYWAAISLSEVIDESFLTALPPIAGFVGWVFLMFGSALASLLGLIASRRAGRNRFVAAFNVVVLMSAVFPLWSFTSFAGLVSLEIWGRSPSIVVVLCWSVVNALVAVLFGLVAARRIEFVQYANR